MATIDLSTRVVLVTGGGRGIGAAICNELALYGARLAVVDVDGKAARETVRRLEGIGAKAIALTADIGEEAQVVYAMDQTLNRFGRLHGLVINPRWNIPAEPDALAVEAWDRTMSGNLRGPFLMAKYAMPLLKLSGGHIVNIAYCGGTQASAGPCACASAWGLLGLSHALRAQLMPYQIKLTTIVPSTDPLVKRDRENVDNGDLACLLDPVHIAGTVRSVLSQPRHAALPEITVVPPTEALSP